MANQEASLPFRFFDPDEEYFIRERKLPHWAQSGTICFITWRTWDSMPREVIEAWLAERKLWLIRHNIDPREERWRENLTKLPACDQCEFHRQLSTRWEANLDECHGACVLRRPELARIVADSLRYFDDDRYYLTDYVVMPNHVHVLAAFKDPAGMLKQCTSWKHYSALRINKILSRQGRFWEVEGFDHLVRSPEQFEHLRVYIAENPRQACLSAGEFIHYSRKEFV